MFRTNLIVLATERKKIGERHIIKIHLEFSHDTEVILMISIITDDFYYYWQTFIMTANKSVAIYSQAYGKKESYLIDILFAQPNTEEIIGFISHTYWKLLQLIIT